MRQPCGQLHRGLLGGRSLGGQVVQVAVDGGPGDAELRGDLRDGMQAAPVGPGLLIHLPGNAGLPWGEFGFLPAGAAAGTGSGQAVDGALTHQGVFELGDRAEDLKEHPPDGGGGVDAMIEQHQVDMTVLQLFGQVDEMFQGAAEPVEFVITS